jgi:hypothetical protein
MGKVYYDGSFWCFLVSRKAFRCHVKTIIWFKQSVYEPFFLNINWRGPLCRLTKHRKLLWKWSSNLHNDSQNHPQDWEKHNRPDQIRRQCPLCLLPVEAWGIMSPFIEIIHWIMNSDHITASTRLGQKECLEQWCEHSWLLQYNNASCMQHSPTRRFL